MDALQKLALSRAGFTTLDEFYEAMGPDAYLEPWLLGYRRVRLQRGDTFYSLAQQYHTSDRAIAAAHPDLDPLRLQIGTIVTVPLGFSLVPTDIPMTSELCRYCVQGLTARYPAFCRSRELARSRYGRPLLQMTIGNGPRRVLYNASHHANEWITTPVLLKFAEDYLSALAFETSIFGYDAQALAEHSTLILVPMVNPDGVDLVTGAIPPDSNQYAAAAGLASNYPGIPFPDGWKANLAGVDLNLNYPAGWDKAREIKFAQGFTVPGPRDFVGFAPLDQPETRAMATLTLRFSPALTLSYHTQGEVIYWKYADYNVPDARAIGERFAEVSGYTLDLVPEASGNAGYKDWFIQQFLRPGYTIEVGLGINPLPLSQFEQIYQDNIGILTLGLTF